MSSRPRFSWLSYAVIVAGTLALATGVASAVGASGKVSALVSATARTAKKGVTKADVQKIVKAQLKNARGPRGSAGPTGPTGAAGPAGAVGPAGPTIGIPIKKLSFRANSGTGLQIPYEGPGMKLEANCLTNGFTLRFRATEVGGIVHAFAVGGQGVTYSGGGVADVNNALDVIPETPIVSGKLEYAAKNGATVTVNYMGAFGTGQADCVFTGTIAETAAA